MRRCFLVLFFWILVFSTVINGSKDIKTTAENEIFAAIYTREKFFDSEAIVPIATAEAYEKLIDLGERNQPKIKQKLGELAEKLWRFDEAEQHFLKANDLEILADFYHRRANFEKEAETMEEIWKHDKRLDIFDRLIEFARIHEIEKYLKPEFFRQAADENPDSLPLIEKLIDKLVEENDESKALEIIRGNRAKFPARMLEKEVSLLDPREAEAAYITAFDPFWSEQQNENFYNFLNENDRFRAFGIELKAKFKREPADFDSAVRLIHYRQYNGDEITTIVEKLQEAKTKWNADELQTIARLLLKDGNSDAASKFLYTLYAQGELTPERREKISYQIFQILCNAGNERLSLAKGDLSFYRDIATSDTMPGISTGILSLIFSDTNPGIRLAEMESAANGKFNRAAAYRVFLSYKKEFPNSPGIAKMYLDLIGIYTKENNPDLANKLLNEFDFVYENSEDFPRAAFGLAKAFEGIENWDKEREVYQKLLDSLGKKREFFAPKSKNEFVSNGFQFMAESDSPTEKIGYSDILASYVASLAKSKSTDKILELYSKEIAKYPDQEWLYEQRLSWLEKTNLFDDQLKEYKIAIEKFPDSGWQDKLARWFIRNKKQTEFEELSADLIGNLDDPETAKYLSEFIDPRIFDEKLYLHFYQIAHQRFPRNIKFVNGLLKTYETKKLDKEWQDLAAEYFFESKEIRNQFLERLAKRGELQNALNRISIETSIGKLFSAEANLRLSNFDEAAANYQSLTEIYPNDAEFAGRLINLKRSFGQKDDASLKIASIAAKSRVEFEPSNSAYLTESGEIFAENSDYENANSEWRKLIENGKGSSESYLEAASTFWDYFQYDEALETISRIRLKIGDQTLYAFEAAAILESQHKESQSISEYLKALENDSERAKNRLVKIAKSVKSFEEIQSIFARESHSDCQILHYCEFLNRLKKQDLAENLLQKQIAKTKDREFLKSAEEFSADTKTFALMRNASISVSPRKAISYRLQLADYYRESSKPDRAKSIVAKLLRDFPNNYGVLNESAEIFWNLGERDAAVNVLKNGFAKSVGEYRFAFASRLAKNLILMDKMAEAEQFLVKLHQEFPADSDVFNELSRVLVIQRKPEKLRVSLAETIAAKSHQDIEPKELNSEIVDIRQRMISAFTELKDYNSAVEQFIEIINRDPESEENVDSAILFVKRYGGGDILTKYYQKTADEAFKNYRWNVVLARISEANGDAENAVKNYNKAIDSQPEMVELYAELVRIESNRKNYGEALVQLNQIIELSGESKDLLKQKIELLQRLGRTSEADAEIAKIPNEKISIPKPDNVFTEAEKAKSTEMFRTAFADLLEKPLVAELNAANIISYVNALRTEEDLDVISARLFELREKLIAEAILKDSKFAGEARNRLKILDGAIPQAIGRIAKQVGTDTELANLHANLSEQIENISTDEQNGTLSLIENLAANSGFGDLVEKILQKRGENQRLIEFYNQRGAFAKILEVAEATNNQPLIAENARLIGDREKELGVLRKLFQESTTDDNHILRYLQIVDLRELESIANSNSPHQLQLINFLLQKVESRLAHLAIENAKFERSWKLARHAETSLALKEFENSRECYFCEALNLGSIGEIIKPQPDKTQQLIGNEWFDLSREYGEWLRETESRNDPGKREISDKFLVAGTENKPKDPAEQVKLGEYYLLKNDLEKALMHFQLADELNPNDTIVSAKIGELLYRSNQKEEAEKRLEFVLKTDPKIYLETMERLNLQRVAREKLFPILVEKLKDNADEKALLQSLAESFESESEKAEFFERLCKISKSNDLAEILLEENLIRGEFCKSFYEILVKGNRISGSDYDFESISSKTVDTETAEEIFDHENSFKLEEAAELVWQQKYLEYLIDNGKTADAKKLIIAIEKDLKGKLPRPIWLRLARINLYGGDLQKIVGIDVSGNIKEPKPPSIERLNEAVSFLRKVKRDAEAEKLILDFYARMLDLGQNEAGNFVGLSRQYFKAGEKKKGSELLQKMVDFGDSSDLNVAAEISLEFGERAAAINFRRKLADGMPENLENQFELAKLLPREEAIGILKSLVSGRDTPRNMRWRAIFQLHEIGEIISIPNIQFDAFSQFYNGILSVDESFLIKSLIIDQEAESQQMQRTIESYVASGKLFAALKLSEKSSISKNEELLELLSKTAESVNEFQKAIDFEDLKEFANQTRISNLQDAKRVQDQRSAELTINENNLGSWKSKERGK